MGEIVRMDNGKDNEIMAIMNDASLCPLLEETKVGVSKYKHKILSEQYS